MCHRISDMGLCKVEKGNTYALLQFREAQFTQLTEVRSKVKGEGRGQILFHVLLWKKKINIIFIYWKIDDKLSKKNTDYIKIQ